MRVWMLSAAMAALVIASAFVGPAMAANAGSDKMKACAAQWSAMPADQKKATTYKQFSSDCLAGKAAAPTTPQARMTACAAQWQKLKAAGKTGGQTYQQFTATCTKKS